ncbi:MAG: bifunctional ADP-dependent NAD(P)H-hydrate dehydratase/NAD(P)H-hydrate epimerase, partial [Deltaproteobacteria bacterium]|nr:bifunctional ADP-dependent NAD(P)H-hydrate dehydratase/NAD(P)H-hydrate epimerase [Deltaproteobacteria bacterium]
DGLVVARHLKKKRIPCEVILLAKKDNLSPDSQANLRLLQKTKGKVTEVDQKSLSVLADKLKKHGLIVDSIFGTGLRDEVRGFYRDVIEI